MNRREQIIDAAEVLFSERGIRDTKVIDIANYLKISKKTIYKHFQGKDEIIRILFRTKYTFVNAEVEAIIKSELSFVAKLASLVLFFRRAFARANQMYFKDMRSFNPQVNQMIERCIQHAVFNRFRVFLTEAIEDEVLKSGTNIDSTVLLYRDTIFSFYTMRACERLPENLNYLKPVDILCENLITIFRGILNNSAEKEFNLLLTGK